MQRYKYSLLPLLIAGIMMVILFGFLATPAYAQEGIVTCGNPGQPDCALCHFFELIQNIIQLLTLRLAPLLAGAAVAVGGFMILLGAGNPGLVEKGKSTITAAVIGIVIAFGAFLIINTVIQAIAGDSNIADSWFRFECDLPPREEPEEEVALCSDPAALAATYGGAGPVEDPELTAIKTCILSDPTVSHLLDGRQVFTFERNNNLCNFTKGNGVCGACAHKVNSCHYGGATSGKGALAVDFNAKDNSRAGERDLFNVIRQLQAQCGFRNAVFEGDHTHINAPSC